MKLVSALFTYSFDPTQAEGLEEIVDKLPSIDALLATHASERPLDQINRIDLAILRLAVFELTYQKLNPAVCIDEAIEIAKSYGADASSKFINAVLGSIVKHV